MRDVNGLLGLKSLSFQDLSFKGAPSTQAASGEVHGLYNQD